MRYRTRTKVWLLRASVAGAATLCGAAVAAQTAADAANAAVAPAAGSTEAAASPLNLRQVFDAAWSRQPEALALQARRDAARAQQSAAKAWTPQPAALEVSNRTDRLGNNQGAREVEVGIAVPLWLPGERGRSAAMADAEGAAIESRANAAQLRVAAAVRDAWWQWQRARIELVTAREQLASTRLIAADVARRAKAGDLARADQHQADGAVAGGEAAVAQAEAGLALARQHLRALAGAAPALSGADDSLAEPDPGASATEIEAHAALQELKDRAAVAQRSVELIATQSRANPELMLATTRDRGARGEASQQTITLGIRIPFGAGPRSDARSANARAEAMEIQAQLALERERLTAEREAARMRVEASRTQLVAVERRAQLARESRGFFDKSFRLGETDLPTRLRIEAEAAEAERQAARTRIELAAAISAWRQALGLLPQ
ncbi:TolC family protein [Rubrivivax rivuli]|uniref:Transporter n=1 Tax=Rubrivivax rivuli TaxID=1862385 RepID=A0A437RIL2_9BURK|nr:TolC family protein [Rubrivivax rivuli]RVU46604.1 transporter [Rubrivivax rivuli]